MQRKWEEAVAQGVVQIKNDGAPAKVQPEELLQGDEVELAYVRANLDAIRLPNGYCFKPKAMDCPAATTPCYTCRAFVTTPTVTTQVPRSVFLSSNVFTIALSIVIQRPFLDVLRFIVEFIATRCCSEKL